MTATAFILLMVGAWLTESALKNRSPIRTLTDIVQNPKNARTELSSGKPFTVNTPAPATGRPGPTNPYGAGATGAAAIAIAYARAQIGKPYRWGATGPDAFDCSGLVWRAYQQAGVFNGVRDTTYTMILKGTSVPNQADLIPGDLVFPDVGHVGIATGNGMFIEAATDGVPIHEVPIWGFFTGRRVA